MPFLEGGGFSDLAGPDDEERAAAFQGEIAVEPNLAAGVGGDEPDGGGNAGDQSGLIALEGGDNVAGQVVGEAGAARVDVGSAQKFRHGG
jgi:hypothetical protein